MAASATASGGALTDLTHRTPFLGLKLYALILILVIMVVAAVLLILLCFRRSSKKRKMRVKHSSGAIPLVSKEILEVNTLELKIEEVDEEDPKKEEMKLEDSPSVESPNIGWGRWYTLSELEAATQGFAEGNVIGEGGYGIVYRGNLLDGSVVAVKNLLNNKGQAEKEFKVEVEAIGKVRHKNLVGLVGYCAEGAQRMLVYEYVDNGTLEQWLHGDVGPVSPLTWDIRMKIAVGTAKGYVSPEYASTGMLNEGSDVYSFGILLMELITGRSPIDYSRPPGEMNLVDWFKGMVANRLGDELVDPLIDIQPSQRSLKRALLVCLRCIDLDVSKRPKMGQIVHMLEADDFPFRSEHRTNREKDPVYSKAAGSSKIPCPTRHVEPVDKSSWR
ncbi:receptor-like serine/threonine-protein [Vigna angularis]|uniref:non-specific serine/threonine protein kinase n=1 Tax=Phaseolus angularis TaxID=3914 RepID=A0A8T0KP53_PHAAN|nr:receptor-like serine/threonine-protein [Vigna angularis]